jgi:hypothetical protein
LAASNKVAPSALQPLVCSGGCHFYESWWDASLL